MSYVNAKRQVLETCYRRFETLGFPLVVDTNIIPKDNTTLLVCSGMQQVKDKFESPDGSKYGSLQSCIRTNDLELVGDGSHLTYFEMIGNFSFGGNDYKVSVELWDSIIRDLGIKVDYVTFHPTRDDHKVLWERKGYNTKPDEGCEWSDGNIGGNCCELFVGDLEIGNLVNPLGHSTDVGFGYERLVQVVEGKTRVDQTSLFRQDVHPIVSDHYRTLLSLRKNGIKPGYSGRDYICRKLVRRLLDYKDDLKRLIEFKDWIESEQNLIEKRMTTGLNLWRRHKDKSIEWWKDTLGIDKDIYDKIKYIKEN